ncbi:MAG: D-cysteine desulfhydrase family protein [Tissierellia bacterium]|nr:D-cysteine desulfhydrase family protein [Tissierellia bacterium]
MDLKLKKLRLANTPTPIEQIQLMEAELPVELYVKRDDLTGVALSGNKIRKLEYIFHQCLEEGITDVITCGALQSNHCRATAFAAAKLGIKAHLLLAGPQGQEVDGNHFLDLMAGAEIRQVDGKTYDQKRDEVMANWAEELTAKGKVCRVIPEGASEALGSFGYLDCYDEIARYEAERNLPFDRIVVTVGSVGTHAGLLYGKKLRKGQEEITGISVSRSRDYYLPRAREIFRGMNELAGLDLAIEDAEVHILEGYEGRGYGLSRPEELAFIRDFTSQTGIILDPVYTGKALYGLITEALEGRFVPGERILFVHTGGAFGWTRRAMAELLRG